MKDEYRAVGSWGTLGLEIVLSVMLGFFGGRWLDARFGVGPWLSLVGFVFGCGAATKAIHRTWTEMQRVTVREEREKGNPSPAYESPKERSPDEPASPITSPTTSMEDPDERAP